MRTYGLLLTLAISSVAFASVTQAADLIVEAAPAMSAVVESSGTWDGPFIGVFGGYGWGSLDIEGRLITPTSSSPRAGCLAPMPASTSP